MNSVLLRSMPADYDPEQQNLLSWSNTPAEGVHLLPGSTHVAVGFADLSDLAAAVSRWKLADGAVPGAAAGQLAAGPYEFERETQDWAAMQEALAYQEWRKSVKQEEAREEAAAERQAAREDAPFIIEDFEDDDDDDDSSSSLEHGLVGAVGSDGTAAAAALQLLQRTHQLNRGAASTATPDAGAAAAGPDGATLAAAAVGSPGQPLLWVGYDASAFAVAKAAVLVEMVQQGADDDAVLQVRGQHRG